MKECFTEADTGERRFCESKHVKGHVKDSLLTACMYWSDLRCIFELHLSGLYREKCTKKSGGVLQFLAASADLD